MPDARPNILMVICHDLGQHLGCYGAGVATPETDALAEQGVRLTNYHCTAAQCSPSRGSILTGRYPHSNGLMGLAHLGWEIKGGERCLPEVLRDAGYSTHLFGVQHETSGPVERLGYESVECGDSRAECLAEAAEAFLAERAGSGAHTPFFASIGTVEPHREYDRPGYEPDDPAEVALLPWLPDRPGIRYDIAHLNGQVRSVDRAVGRIARALDASGLAEDTLLIFTTDHGLAMPRAKGTCYDPGAKTTLIARLPGRFLGGVARDELLTNCDLLPTLCDLLDLAAPEGVQGQSFLPLLAGGECAPRESIHLEMTWHDLYNPMRAVRTSTHKYVRSFGDLPLVYLPRDVWMGAAGQEVAEEYYGSRRPAELLYDLRDDPLEMRDVAGEPAQAGVLAALRGRVEGFMRETGDRLLEGDWPPCERQRAVIEERAKSSDLQRRWLEASRGTLLQGLGV
jgi:N-sulfoglucosamine sulfohydrolase